MPEWAPGMRRRTRLVKSLDWVFWREGKTARVLSWSLKESISSRKAHGRGAGGLVDGPQRVRHSKRGGVRQVWEAFGDTPPAGLKARADVREEGGACTKSIFKSQEEEKAVGAPGSTRIRVLDVLLQVRGGLHKSLLEQPEALERGNVSVGRLVLQSKVVHFHCTVPPRVACGPKRDRRALASGLRRHAELQREVVVVQRATRLSTAWQGVTKKFPDLLRSHMEVGVGAVQTGGRDGERVLVVVSVPVLLVGVDRLFHVHQAVALEEVLESRAVARRVPGEAHPSGAIPPDSRRPLAAAPH